MNNIRVLDCTLRDGGYCNQWQFGFENIKKIINGLTEAGADIIECGFLTNRAEYNRDITKFTSMEEVSAFIPEERSGNLYVCLMNYDEFQLDDIPPCNGQSLDGIRVAFHKKNRIPALAFCEGLKSKGYKAFIQAMVSLNYSDNEFLQLIESVNKIKPYAFYIVDSFGVMKWKDLIRLFYMVEHNLDPEIQIGYHAHNNMQLAYANAQALCDVRTSRNLIIDSSIYGMGRGAGNLNTELFMGHLNDNMDAQYNLKPLLTVIDEVLNRFYLENPWGYSLPNYLSASYNCHPDYASYLDDKRTLTIENMDEIFSMIEEEKKNSFSKDYIEELYNRYMVSGQTYEEHLTELRERLENKEVLIIAPGKSVEEEKDKVIACAGRENVISISINHDYAFYDTDYIFLSNIRRFRELDRGKRGKTIITSNIHGDGVYLQTKYSDLLNEVAPVRDNAGMMLIRFLIHMGVKKILVAGMDGYSHDIYENYADRHMIVIMKNAVLEAMNDGMSEMLNLFSKEVEIKFITEQKFIHL